VLDAEGLEYEVISDTVANIYGKVNLSQLVLALAKEECELISSHEQDESLENYFINLVGGEHNE
jgi:ABC-2 type transport system ATP-binding protein